MTCTCHRWFARFRDGDRDLVDKPRSGRPESLNRDDLKEAVDANPFLTTRELGIQALQLQLFYNI